MRLAIAASALLLAGALLLVIVGTSSAPIRVECSPDLPDGACEGAISAVLRRGLPEAHPLILVAYVEPGAAPGAQELGHRATVVFDLLGVPTPTTIELYYDQAAHWGGVSDRSDAEVAAWTLAPLFVAILLGVGILILAWSRRKAGPPPVETGRQGAHHHRDQPLDRGDGK